MYIYMFVCSTWYVDIKSSHSGPKAQYQGIPELMACRILGAPILAIVNTLCKEV